MSRGCWDEDEETFLKVICILLWMTYLESGSMTEKMQYVVRNKQKLELISCIFVQTFAHFNSMNTPSASACAEWEYCFSDAETT